VLKLHPWILRDVYAELTDLAAAVARLEVAR
jgi:hypothetical protein